jgi:hypothetical protein
MSKVEPVYCEDCKYCSPDNGLSSLFGLQRTYSIKYAVCLHPHARRPNFTLRLPERINREEQYFCTSQNLRGQCEDFEVKV